MSANMSLWGGTHIIYKPASIISKPPSRLTRITRPARRWRHSTTQETPRAKSGRNSCSAGMSSRVGRCVDRPRAAGALLRQRLAPRVAAPGAHLDRRSEAMHDDRAGLDREGAGDAVGDVRFVLDRDPLGAEGAGPGGEIG